AAWRLVRMPHLRLRCQSYLRCMARIRGQRIVTLVAVLAVLWGVLLFAGGLASVWYMPTLARGWHLGMTRSTGKVHAAATFGQTSQPAAVQGGGAAGQSDAGAQNFQLAGDALEPPEATEPPEAQE